MRNLVLLCALAGCAVDDLDTSTATSDLSQYQWTDDVQIANQQAYGQPALASYGGYLHMIHSGSSDANELWWSRFSGSWSANQKLSLRAGNNVGLASFGGQLVMVYQPEDQNRLVMARSTTGTTWSVPVTAGTTLGTDRLTSGVSLAVFNNNLFAAYCKDTGDRDMVQLDRFDGTAWTTSVNYFIDSGFRCNDAVVAPIPDTGRLHLIYTVGNSNFVYQMYEATGRTGTPNLYWDNPVYMNMASTKPMSIVTCIDRNNVRQTHLVHGGQSSPDEIWWSYRYNGAWVPNLRIPNQASHGGSTLGCYGSNRTIMVHDGGTNQLWWSEFGP